MKAFLEALSKQCRQKEAFNKKRELAHFLSLPISVTGIDQAQFPPAVKAYRQYLEQPPPQPGDDAAKSAYFVNYFQYRSAARLAISPDDVQHLAWTLFYDGLKKNEFMRNELATIASYEDYLIFLEKYLILFSNAIYQQWDNWLCSDEPHKDSPEHKSRKKAYLKFNEHFINGQTANAFVPRTVNPHLDFNLLFVEPAREAYRNDKDQNNYDRNLSLCYILQDSIDLIPFAPVEYAKTTLRKTLVSSHPALVIALFKHQLRGKPEAQFDYKKLAVKADAIRARVKKNEPGILEKLVTPAVHTQAQTLSSDAMSIAGDDDLTLDTFDTFNPNKRSTLILQYIPGETALLTTALAHQKRRLENKRRLQETATGLSGLLYTLKRKLTCSYNIIDDKLNFIQNLTQAIENRTLNIYTLYQLTEKYPWAMYRFGTGISHTEEIFNLAHDNLFSNNREMSEFLMLMLRYETLKTQNPSAIKTFFGKSSDKISLSHLLIFYNSSNPATQKKIIEFYSDYITYRLHKYIKKNSPDKRISSSLLKKTQAHFCKLLFDKQNSTTDIDTELSHVRESYKIPTHELESALAQYNKDNTYSFFAKKSSTNSNRTLSISIIAPENEKADLVIRYEDLGSGTFGQVSAVQKIPLKLVESQLALNQDEFPQNLAEKIFDRNDPNACLSEKWRLAHTGQEARVAEITTEYRAPNDRSLEKVTRHAAYMPLIPGQDLDKFRPSPNNPNKPKKTNLEIWQIAYQILEQIRSQYILGYYHCDLKLNNIVGDEDHVQMVDFGGILGSILSKHSGLVITPDYAPAWFKEKLRKHISDYGQNNIDGNMQYKSCTFEYNLAVLLNSVGKIILCLKSWVTYMEAPVIPLRDKATLLEREEYYLSCMNKCVDLDTLPESDAYDPEAQELFAYAKELMSSGSNTPKNYTLEHLNQFIDTSRAKLGLPTPPAPLTRLYTR
jgi:hypothetical protein